MGKNKSLTFFLFGAFLFLLGFIFIRSTGKASTGPVSLFNDKRMENNPTSFPSISPVEPRSDEDCIAQMVFSSTGPDDLLKIKSMNADGSMIKSLTDLPFEDMDPVWSPDGKQIAFVSNNGSGSKVVNTLFIMNADGSGEHQLTRGIGSCHHPAWSPDGKTISFSYEYNRQSEIDLINVDGTNFKRLVSDLNMNGYPDWSPDGKQLAFSSSVWNEHRTKLGTSDIYFVNLDGTNLTKLTSSPADDYSPAWSPDGKKLAFVSKRHGSADIYIVHMEDKIAKQITLNSESDEDHPTWSPDSNFIAFDSNRDNPLGDIYRMDVNMGEWKRLTFSEGKAKAIQPDWSRACR
jgi:TolB protein